MSGVSPCINSNLGIPTMCTISGIEIIVAQLLVLVFVQVLVGFTAPSPCGCLPPLWQVLSSQQVAKTASHVWWLSAQMGRPLRHVCKTSNSPAAHKLSGCVTTPHSIPFHPLPDTVGLEGSSHTVGILSAPPTLEGISLWSPTNLSTWLRHAFLADCVCLLPPLQRGHFIPPLDISLLTKSI